MTATFSDPYTALGLSPDADEEAIRQAFRRLALQLHPDRNPDPLAAEAFLRVRTAYESLLHPSQREAESVMASVMRAAAAAERTRPSVTIAHRPVSLPLAVGGRGLPAAEALRALRGLVFAALAAVTLAILTGSAVFLLANAVSLCAALVVWFTRKHPVALRLYGDGFEDERWPEAGRIGWGDISALEADHAAGTLDLVLSTTLAEALTACPDAPRGVLVGQGNRPGYRLSFGADAKPAIAAIEARTGLSAH
ncbi:MAG: J domain-containing protein [Rubricoccaceae bacterium]|nr:J domain-containing protein [Rubricoccaceae bacterium]